MTSPLDNVIRLTVSEAARMFGVSSRTIRRAIADKLVTYVVVQGRYKINFESLLRWSQSSTTVRNKRDREGIGQFVENWRIRNTLYSPNPEAFRNDEGRGSGVGA
jgi:excisionase family DNA binding protein